MTPIEPSMAVVEMIGVTKRFRKAAVVSDLNLSISRGTTLGLIGPNGAGKSTTIRMLMGTLAPTAGQVRVFGMDVRAHGPRIRGRVGYVPERHDIYSWMTVSEAIDFTQTLYPNWDHACCRQLLDMFTLDGRKKVKHLSKGMLVKLGLLLAVSHRPELLFSTSRPPGSIRSCTTISWKRSSKAFVAAEPRCCIRATIWKT